MRWLLVVVLVLGCKHKFDPIEARDIRGTAVAVGAPAPDALVVSSSGGKLSLTQLTRDNAKTVVVFYRGFY